MPTYMLSDNEKSDLRRFVEMVAKVGLLSQDVLGKIDINRLTKNDLTKIQKKIDSIIGGATLEPQSGTGQYIHEILMLAAKAHRALARIRVYDWK